MLSSAPVQILTLPAVPKDFDLNDYLFACGNDVIDLRTGAFRPGRRWDMLTNVSPIYWVPEAESELLVEVPR